MDIVSVRIENFLTIGEATLDLKNKGLVLIQGKNEDDPSADSNGAGKSSLPDAVCFCLYGETARGVKGDAVINKTAKKNCRVKVQIDDDGEIYTVLRHRKHKDGKSRILLFKESDTFGPKDLTLGTDKLTQEKINQIMGCSLDVFRAAVYAGQEAMPDLPGMTDKQLKLLVEEAAGIDRLQDAHEVAKVKARDAERVHELEETNLVGYKSRVEDHERALEEQETQFARWEVDQKEKIDEQVSLAKTLASTAKDKVAELSLLKEAEVFEQLEKLEKQLLGSKTERGKEVELRGVAEQKQRDVNLGENDLKRSLTEVKRAKDEFDHLHDKVGKKCGECGKVYELSDMEEATTIAQSKISKLGVDARAIKTRVDEAKIALKDALSNLEKHQYSMTDISEVVASQRDLNVKVAEIEACKKTIETIKSNAKDAVEKVKTLKSEVNPYTVMIETTGKRIEEMKKLVKTTAANIDELEAQKELTSEAVKVFGPAGVRAHILDTVTPFLNSRTAHYLGTMSDGNITAMWSTLTKTTKGDLREKFNIEVVNDKGAESFAGLSGGEKRKVRLASAMALQDMVASRATKPINLFIADEVDHALDEAGLERLMGILDEKARERGSVLVISHNELSDWIRDQALVTKSEGMAKVTGVLS